MKVNLQTLRDLPRFVRGWARAATAVWTGEPSLPVFKVDRETAEHLPPPPDDALRIVLRFYDATYGYWRMATIGINRADATFARETDSWLLNRQHEGAAAIGAFALTAPMALLLLPVVHRRNRAFAKQERRAGMSRHAVALLAALDGLLEPEERDLLVRALRNEWRAEQEAQRRVTFEEAAELLLTCKAHEYTPVSNDFMHYSDEGTVSMTWHDDNKRKVAEATLYVKEDECVLSVRGSHFSGDQAKQLMKLFRVCDHYKGEEYVAHSWTLPAQKSQE